LRKPRLQEDLIEKTLSLYEYFMATMAQASAQAIKQDGHIGGRAYTANRETL